MLINLASDTSTLPSPEMRDAMATAKVDGVDAAT